jgi:hypothetical protein
MECPVTTKHFGINVGRRGCTQYGNTHADHSNSSTAIILSRLHPIETVQQEVFISQMKWPGFGQKMMEGQRLPFCKAWWLYPWDSAF